MAGAEEPVVESLHYSVRDQGGDVMRTVVGPVGVFRKVFI